MKAIFLSVLFMVMGLSAGAQASLETIIDSDKPITWLGLDFGLTRYIGEHTQFKDAGEISTSEMRDKYINGWNELFVNEQKKYDVAKYFKRESVSFGTEVTEAANNKVKDIFSNNPDEYSRLTEADIVRAVKKYDFKNRKGTGLIFFVEGMHKGKEEAAAWVTFVDMTGKSVLATQRIKGNAGGIGFRNYWAKAFLNILKNID